MLEQYLEWFKNLDIYKNWIIELPEPLNNAAFISIVALGLVIFIIMSIVNQIANFRWKMKQAKAKRRLEEKRLRDEEYQMQKDRQNASDRELMNTYLKFLVTAQMQNMTSLQNITFEQWKTQMSKMNGADFTQQPVVKEQPYIEEVLTDELTQFGNAAAYVNYTQNKADVRNTGIVAVVVENASDSLVQRVSESILEVWDISKCYRVSNNRIFVVLNNDRFVIKKIAMLTEILLSVCECGVSVGYACAADINKKKFTFGDIEKAALEKAVDISTTYEEDIQEVFEEVPTTSDTKSTEAADNEVNCNDTEVANTVSKSEKISEQAEDAKTEKTATSTLAGILNKFSGKKEAKDLDITEAELEVTPAIEKVDNTTVLKYSNTEDDAAENEEPEFDGVINLPKEIEQPVEQEKTSADSDDTVSEVDFSALTGYSQNAQAEDSDSSELSSEQQNDFAKLIAQMAAEQNMQSKIQEFQKEKSEIIKRNLSTLDRKAAKSAPKDERTGGRLNKSDSNEEEIKRRKEAAIRQIAAEQEDKTRKKGFFRKK